MPRVLQERRFPPGGCISMETIRDYRKFAEECYRLARGIKDPEHKKILEEMAEAWLRLADEAARKGLRPRN
jgi:hypothetical protein